MSKIIRGQKAQGDVLLTPISELPDGVARSREKRTIALGEATGHHHSFSRDVEIYTQEGDPRMWVVLEEEEMLTHQEHETIILEPGVYEYNGQTEPDPFTGMARRVRD